MTYFSRRWSSASTASLMNCARPYVPTSALIRAIVSGARRTGSAVMWSGLRPMRGSVAAICSAGKKTIPFSVDALNGTDYINGIVLGGKAMQTEQRNHTGRTDAEQAAYEAKQDRWDAWFQARQKRDATFAARNAAARQWGEW